MSARKRDFGKVVLVYKKSLYQIYFLDGNEHLSPNNIFSATDVDHLMQAHKAHESTLNRVKNHLSNLGIKYRELYRSRQVRYQPDDLIISLGGDGTFLEAASQCEGQLILGVNSNPQVSVGNFCAANETTFAPLFERILSGQFKIKRLHRIELVLNGQPSHLRILNDILVAHRNPAAMSRYRIRINDIEEQHHNSGIWISTAAGSSGAISAAGGRRMAQRSRRLQYLPRELYSGKNRTYQLCGGILQPEEQLVLVSLMREGKIYVDGSHHRIPFAFGSRLEIIHSQYPLHLIMG